MTTPGGHAVLVGATASGKSALALAVARRDRSWELVSVDSMQVYRGMDIGTAKPTAAERAAVPHHLIDVAEVLVTGAAPHHLIGDLLAVTARPRHRTRIPVLSA